MYFISFVIRRRVEGSDLYHYDFNSLCIDNHPFEWLEGVNVDPQEKFILLNFVNISEEDYHRFNQ